MKKQLPSLILTVILIACLIFCAIEISSLRQEVEDLGNCLSSEVVTLRRDLSNVAALTSQAVSDALNEDSDPLRSIDWEWLALNAAERTVLTRITAVPKAYDPQNTMASLTIGGQTIPMTLVGSEYVAEISLPLLADTEITTMQLTDGSTVRTSLVNATLRPRSSFLPRISATFPGRGTGRAQNDAYTWDFTGSVELVLSTPREHISFTDIALITRVGGEEISRQPLTGLTASPGETATAWVDGSTQSSNSYSSELDLTASTPFGSTLEVYVEAADSLGLIHRVWMWGYEISGTGEMTNIPGLPEYFGAIYAPDGTLLYHPDELIHQPY